MQITYFGHSCFQLEIAGKKVLFDPFILPNQLAEDIDISTIKPDYIFISHGHQDHVSDVEDIYRQSEAKIVSTFEVVSWFEEQGLDNIHPMNHGGEWKFDFGTVKMVNAVHSSAMPDGSYGGNPSGFVFTIEGKSFYYAGDTALHYDMKLIAEEFDIDFAFMPIGSNFTMGVKDAVKAADFVNTSKVIGMHYDTFPFIEIDHDEAKSLFQKADKELILMKIGENINI
ncbi:metal-dependent hydrolase [Fulvivirga sp. RKSG066]|uniref:metal-dependent hydrolase n=1 Tax=Fulvivirga aurantia TaxID=2529383 RepID=UPI0012BC02F2|nr:metal-dependent hydrolase [Fulvivirga aurantia]MTI20761.1 metal-dependent hydrolase [Fulvivirga aurantia]